MDFAAQAELTQRPAGLGDRPAARVEAVDHRLWSLLERPRGPGGSRATAEIEDAAHPPERGAERTHDLPDEQEVERPEIEGESRALAGATEGIASCHSPAPLDVERRQRLQRPTDLGEAKLRQMPRLERRVVRGERIGRGRHLRPAPSCEGAMGVNGG